jgi:tRNA-splicing ligase RtcB
MKDWPEELKALEFKPGRAFGKMLEWIRDQNTFLSEDQIMAILIKFRDYPENFLDEPTMGPIAIQLRQEAGIPNGMISLTPEESSPQAVIFGREHIENGALDQMKTAMTLPIAVAGALMPDAHQGYGLPIGGVLATENTVIPYGVGVDIGCRMALSVFDISADYLINQRDKLIRILTECTLFGAGKAFEGKARADHPVLEDPVFQTTPFLKSLRDKSWAQLGTSGGGNHFVEWGMFRIKENKADCPLPAGDYLSLLSHSGSRGMGATIANHFTSLAREICVLPRQARDLAFLDLDTEEGNNYWDAMNLAGNYASACHDIIHKRISSALSAQTVFKVENHHNFAWKEMHQGRELIVHRKGATPAGKGVLGIIPGSMASPGFVVRGLGNDSSLQSASHGAGRLMSRTQAVKTLQWNEIRIQLENQGIFLLGGGLDEAPQVYKDIRKVMACQAELVEVIAEFHPSIVRMADDGSRED